MTLSHLQGHYSAQYMENPHNRLVARLYMMYRIQYGLIDVSSEHKSHSLRGHPMMLQQIRTRVKPYEASFFPATVTPWNRLPASAVTVRRQNANF